MYKLYKSGQEFLDENLNIIRNDPLGATFFEGNANVIQQCNESNFALRVETDGELLLSIRVDGYPLVVYGSERCAGELAHAVANNKLQFGKVIGYYDLSNAFLTCYEGLVGGSHRVNLSMDVMYCKKVATPCDTSGVERATEQDVKVITQMIVNFAVEALVEKPIWGKIFDKVAQKIDTYAVYRVNGKIVSVAHSYADGELQRVSNVYTLPEHRNKGYSRKVVTYLTQQALNNGKLPCLHVDQHNPVSNHLYLTIGYQYGKSRYEMIYTPTVTK